MRSLRDSIGGAATVTRESELLLCHDACVDAALDQLVFGESHESRAILPGGSLELESTLEILASGQFGRIS